MNTGLIVAAGKGSRMGKEIDKLFLAVAGKPVVAHTWQRFDSAQCIDDLVLVVRDGLEDDLMSAGSVCHIVDGDVGRWMTRGLEDE